MSEACDKVEVMTTETSVPFTKKQRQTREVLEWSSALTVGVGLLGLLVSNPFLFFAGFIIASALRGILTKGGSTTNLVFFIGTMAVFFYLSISVITRMLGH